MAKHPEITGFIPTIKKPDNLESLAIVAAQKKNFNRMISCTFKAGKNDEFIRSRIPARHLQHNMEEEVKELIADMQKADYIQIIDLSER